MNLLDNACRYSGPDAPVVLTTGPGPLGARLEVLDRGPGFDAESLGHLFEPFWRSPEARREHAGGTGLGLALVKALVDAHGGRVAAANRPDGGARITVDLPSPTTARARRHESGVVPGAAPPS
jgi:signal transduction histidine kinase